METELRRGYSGTARRKRRQQTNRTYRHRATSRLYRPLPTADVGYPAGQLGGQLSGVEIARPADAGRPGANLRCPNLAALKLPVGRPCSYPYRAPRRRVHVGGQSRRLMRSPRLWTVTANHLGSPSCKPSAGSPGGRPMALRSSSNLTAQHLAASRQAHGHDRYAPGRVHARRPAPQAPSTILQSQRCCGVVWPCRLARAQ